MPDSRVGATKLTHTPSAAGDEERLNKSHEKYEAVQGEVRGGARRSTRRCQEKHEAVQGRAMAGEKKHAEKPEKYEAPVPEEVRAGECKRRGEAAVQEKCEAVQGEEKYEAVPGEVRGGARRSTRRCKEKYEVVPPAKVAALEAGMHFYIVSKVKLKAASLQPHLHANNDYHEGMGRRTVTGLLKAVARAVKSPPSVQGQEATEHDGKVMVRTCLPARHGAAVHAHALDLHSLGRV
ncbi:hypothetical protein CYMTET_53242 [Cymbomonas tetramitiformis]|uniref:Uncharacterized protein n=1 Tax=Cymbomonas tetramitiformis TaxID=36881 RepID=A0AAE0BHL8_9CHLO|nr:hypothetical protein CYMTET_53242 [Cymbomonas tetramitiformis]